MAHTVGVSGSSGAGSSSLNSQGGRTPRGTVATAGAVQPATRVSSPHLPGALSPETSQAPADPAAARLHGLPRGAPGAGVSCGLLLLDQSLGHFSGPQTSSDTSRRLMFLCPSRF